MERMAWEDMAEAYDSTYDGISIPYERTREEEFQQLDKDIEELNDDNKMFALWELTRWYLDKLKMPEQIKTKEQFYEYNTKHNIQIGLHDLIEVLGFELW